MVCKFPYRPTGEAGCKLLNAIDFSLVQLATFMPKTVFSETCQWKCPLVVFARWRQQHKNGRFALGRVLSFLVCVVAVPFVSSCPRCSIYRWTWRICSNNSNMGMDCWQKGEQFRTYFASCPLFFSILIPRHCSAPYCLHELILWVTRSC